MPGLVRLWSLRLVKGVLLAIALTAVWFVLTSLGIVSLHRGWRIYNARPTQFLLVAAIAAWLAWRLRPGPETRAWWRATPGRRAGLGAALAIAIGAAAWAWLSMIHMPGWSHSGALDPLTPGEERVRDALRRDVGMLADTLGVRNYVKYDALHRAAEFLEQELRAAGLEPRRQTYAIRGRDYHNLEVEIRGTSRPDEILIVGGHYDSAEGAPGADDNATGAAAVLALARAFAGRPHSRTLRLIEYVNEEPPHFQGPDMGSLVSARACRERGDRIVAMLSLETMGYFDERMGTQTYPFLLGLFYPSSGDFIAFAGDTGAAPLVRDAVERFRRLARFPSAGAAIPGFVPGVGWSDHWAYRQFGYPAILVTDTAPFRNPHYHRDTDTVDRLDFARLARVVAGLERVVAEMLDAP